MKKLLLLKICFVFLLTTFSSVYAGSCFDEEPYDDIADCQMKAALGDADAQHNLGVIYDEGRGVPQDLVMAHMFFNLAAVSGFKKSIKGRGIIEKLMTPSQ